MLRFLREGNMAKLTPGALISGASGAQGTIVFSRNRGGFYSKARVTPANPNTTAQATWRANIKFASQRWGTTLTQAQRDQWTQRATELTATGTLGQRLRWTGFNLYVSVNARAKTFAGANLDTPPAAPVYPQVLKFAVDARITAAHFNSTWTSDLMTSSGRIIIFVTKPLSAGRSASNGTWTHLVTYTSSQAQPQNAYTAYTGIFGVPTAGMKTFFRVYSFALGTYMTGPYLHGFTTWAA